MQREAAGSCDYEKGLNEDLGTVNGSEFNNQVSDQELLKCYSFHGLKSGLSLKKSNEGLSSHAIICNW